MISCSIIIVLISAFYNRVSYKWYLVCHSVIHFQLPQTFVPPVQSRPMLVYQDGFSTSDPAIQPCTHHQGILSESPRYQLAHQAPCQTDTTTLSPFWYVASPATNRDQELLNINKCRHKWIVATYTKQYRMIPSFCVEPYMFFSSSWE